MHHEACGVERAARRHRPHRSVAAEGLERPAVRVAEPRGRIEQRAVQIGDDEMRRRHRQSSLKDHRAKTLIGAHWRRATFARHIFRPSHIRGALTDTTCILTDRSDRHRSNHGNLRIPNPRIARHTFRSSAHQAAWADDGKVGHSQPCRHNPSAFERMSFGIKSTPSC